MDRLPAYPKNKALVRNVVVVLVLATAGVYAWRKSVEVRARDACDWRRAVPSKQAPTSSRDLWKLIASIGRGVVAVATLHSLRACRA